MHLITENIKTGHYRNNHDTRDYYITFEYNDFWQRSIDSDSTERKYKINPNDIARSILMGGFYLVKEIKTEVVNTDKKYKQYSDRKTSKGKKVKDINQTSLF